MTAAERKARREQVREFAKRVAALSEGERAALANKMPVVNTSGRPLSLHNVCLLYYQRNGGGPLTVVAGYRQWLRAGRQVKKGEHGMTIWVPVGLPKLEDEEAGGSPAGFVFGTVFDISQTEDRAAVQ